MRRVLFCVHTSCWVGELAGKVRLVEWMAPYTVTTFSLEMVMVKAPTTGSTPTKLV
jgi:hypothetical protein